MIYKSKVVGTDEEWAMLNRGELFQIQLLKQNIWIQETLSFNQQGMQVCITFPDQLVTRILPMKITLEYVSYVLCSQNIIKDAVVRFCLVENTLSLLAFQC